MTNPRDYERAVAEVFPAFVEGWRSAGYTGAVSTPYRVSLQCVKAQDYEALRRAFLALESKLAEMTRQRDEAWIELAQVLGEARSLAWDCGEMNTADDYEARRASLTAAINGKGEKP